MSVGWVTMSNQRRDTTAAGEVEIEQDSADSETPVHESAIGHVTGAAVYVDDDVSFGDRKHVAIGGSPVAHGRIRSIDLTQVREASGVIDVITANDIPGHHDIGPVFPGDLLLTDGLVEFVGQPIFAVLADSHNEARRAVTLAEIEIDEETPVLDLQQAIDDEFYVRPPHTMKRGDAERVFVSHSESQPDNVIEGMVAVGGQEHFYLEGQVAMARFDEDGGFVIKTSNQHPSEAQKLVAEVMAVPLSRVVVETRRMGGGFGGKESQANACCCLAAIFAQRNRTAVVCRLSRRDDMVMTGKRHNFINRYRAAFDAEGQIEAVHYELAAQCGLSPDLSDAIVDRAMFHSDNAYYLPNATIDGLRCKTHTVSNTAFRGFGGPQGMMAMETVIDEIAFAVGKDPLDIRKLNFYDTGARATTPYHQRITTFNLPPLVEQLEVESDYRGRRVAVDQFNRENPIVKKGLALTPVKFGISFTATHLNQAGALLHLYTDGSLLLNHGGTEMGQGLFTKVAQIVSTVLGVSSQQIRVTATRTDKVPNTSPTAASSGTDLNGMAALQAAVTLKARLIDFLVQSENCQASSIEFSEQGVTVGATRSLSWAELATAAWQARVSLSANGFYSTPDIYYDREKASGRPFLYYATGAAVSEVMIDTLTGESRVLRTDIIHDVGHSINSSIDKGQIEGGFVQGMGWLTTEELVWDASGRLLTDGPATYKIPAIADAPDEFNVRLWSKDCIDESAVLGSKAVGEPPLMLAISVWCAIRDAIGAAGNYKAFPKLNAPATPEEILRCLTAVKNTPA